MMASGSARQEDVATDHGPPSAPRRFRYPAHQYIEVFEDAARLSKHRVCLTHYPYETLQALQARSLLLAQLLRPLLLGLKLWKRRHQDLILVREFITIPVLVAAPVLWWFRRKTLFILVHNVQMAAHRRRDRIALRWLFRLGFRFVALESTAGLKECGIVARPDQVLVLPLGFVESRPPGPPRQRTRRTIGVVGRFRREKSIARLLDRLAAATDGASIDAKVLVGCDDDAILALAAEHGFETRDTTQYDDYLDALDSVDILVLDYDRDRYFYRTSAVVADSAFRGKVVICPDYPVFRAQIGEPVPVGVALASWDQLPQVVERALTMTANAEDRVATYIAFRRPDAIARRLDAFLDRRAAASGDAQRSTVGP